VIRRIVVLGGMAVATAVIAVALIAGPRALAPAGPADPISTAMPDPTAVAVASASPSLTPTPGPLAATAAPSVQSKTSAPTAPNLTPTPSAVAATGKPILQSATSAPTALASGTVLTITVDGIDYVSADTDGAVIHLTPQGTSLRIESTGKGTSHVAYTIPPAALPPGTTLGRIDLKLCGAAGGNFWEIYGPSGSDTNEQEVTQPLADGCWHFENGFGDSSYVDVYVVSKSFLRIDKLFYTVTVA
jgi:hypothetical protein